MANCKQSVLSAPWSSRTRTVKETSECSDDVVARREIGVEPSMMGAIDTMLMPPNGMNPAKFIETNFKSVCPQSMHFAKGTTTLAFAYEPATPNDKGGIIVAVDSRASGGEYIASKTVLKVLDIAPHLVATMCGGAADCQFWVRVLAQHCSLHALQEKEIISVAAASKVLANMLARYRGMGLSVYTMVAGYDKTGPKIYLTTSDGTRVTNRLFSVGSGSMYAMGVLDAFYKEKMTDEEALKLGREAIVHATYRDIGSGGKCNIVHITRDAKIKHDPIDVSDYIHEKMPMGAGMCPVRDID